MIEITKKTIKRPTIDEIFYNVNNCQGISLFSSFTESDCEYTGFNPVVIIKENELISGKNVTIVNDPLNELNRVLSEFKDLPKEISLLGYISYDFKDRFEEEDLYEKQSQNIFPDFYFAIYEHYIISSRTDEEAEFITLNFPFKYNSKKYNNSHTISPPKGTAGKTLYKGTSLNKNQFENAVRKTKDYIKKGHIYQANITRSILGETTLSPLEMALSLYQSNRISYGVFAAIEGKHIYSTSPELFFEIKDGQIMASPIKGTINREENIEKDNENRISLLNSEKNIAELAMIVDLLRNDLSSVSIPGTVQVPQFPLLMTLDNVYHLYANVKGQLSPQFEVGDVLKKIFPGGSITGCPKIRSCQIIDELETSPRGIYTGSFGKISFNGDCIFNIMIRSLFQNDNQIIFNVGGGITLLSDPEEEYEETIHKGKNIWKSIKMEEKEEEQYYSRGK